MLQSSPGKTSTKLTSALENPAATNPGTTKSSTSTKAEAAANPTTRVAPAHPRDSLFASIVCISSVIFNFRRKSSRGGEFFKHSETEEDRGPQRINQSISHFFLPQCFSVILCICVWSNLNKGVATVNALAPWARHVYSLHDPTKNPSSVGAAHAMPHVAPLELGPSTLVSCYMHVAPTALLMRPRLCLNSSKDEASF